MSKNDWDVVIVGGSFAGLATAHFIGGGDVLILERQSRLGKTQRSTCCTSVDWIERLGCGGAILKKIQLCHYLFKRQKLCEGKVS